MINRLDITTKVENEGVNAEGRLSAEEFNNTVSKINEIVDDANMTNERLLSIAKPFVEGEVYEQGTLISYNNVLYTVSVPSTGEIPSPDNGNYTVLINAESAAERIDDADEAMAFAIADIINLYHPTTASDYVFKVAAGSTVRGTTYQRDTIIQNSAFADNKSAVIEVFKMHNSLAPSLFSTCSFTVFRGASNITLSNSTDCSYAFMGCAKMTRVLSSTWDFRPTNIAAMFHQCRSLEMLDLSGLDLSRCTSTNIMFHGCKQLRYVTLSPKFFAGTCTLCFIAQQSPNDPPLGLDIDGNDNGWLQHLVSVAPIIRSKAGYTELLEQEGGQWYLNDGIGRTIQLPSALKNATWAASYLTILTNKGYTIA